MTKRYSLAVVICLAVASGVVGQKKDAPKISYDKFKDRTRIETADLSIPLVNARGTSATLTVSASHPGTTPTPPVLGALNFSVYSRYGFTFDVETTLILLIDGERIQIEDVDCHRFLNAGPYVESAWAPVDLDTLKRIAKARTVEGQLGSVEFKIPAERQRAIAALVQYFP